MITISISGINLICELVGDTIVINDHEGITSRLIIPDVINVSDREYTVSNIGKKAFLGMRSLKHVSIPGTVRYVGDWAFAQCDHLLTMTIRDNANGLTMGRGVFEDCKRLEAICLGYEEADDLAYLMAAVIYRLPAPYLFASEDMGEESWYKAFDQKLVSYLNTSDDDGYTDRVLCGEEDIAYDDIGSVDGEMPGETSAYIMEVKKRKCYLAFLRLMHDINLSDEKRQTYTEYVKRFKKGSKENESAWLTIKDDMADDIEYFKLYTRLMEPSAEEIDAMLEDLGDQNAEAKVHLIKYKQDNAKDNDPFADMFL